MSKRSAEITRRIVRAFDELTGNLKRGEPIKATRVERMADGTYKHTKVVLAILIILGLSAPLPGA